MSSEPRTFRFRPRRTVLPYAAGFLGLLFIVAALTGEYTPSWALPIGAVGVLSAVMHRLSPAWRLVVVVDDTGVSVRRGSSQRLHIPWSEARLVHAAPQEACYIDAGDAARRLVVPGPGMRRVPYVIENHRALVDLLVARVPAERRAEADALGV